MNTAIVWRVENSEGQGPYTARWNLSWCDKDTDQHQGPRHPGPHTDYFCDEALRRLNRDGFFGFESKEQLEAWFSPTELERLAGMGFTVAQVEAEQVFRGSKQVIFVRKKS